MGKTNEAMAKEALKTVESALRTMGLRFQRDLSGEMCYLIVEGEDIPMPINLWAEPDYYLVVMNSVLPFFVKEDRFDRIAIALNEINSRIINGVFYLDRKDKVIKFKMVDSYLGGPIGADAIRFNVEILLNTVDKYNDRLCDLNDDVIDVGFFVECI